MHDSPRVKFWAWLTMAFANLYSVVVGLKYGAYDVVGYSGFFLTLTTIFTVYYWFRLKREELT